MRTPRSFGIGTPIAAAIDSELTDPQRDIRRDHTLSVLPKMVEAERKAIDALSRYKFLMFGYWAAVWVHLNRLSGTKNRNPFASFVSIAKHIKSGTYHDEFHP